MTFQELQEFQKGRTFDRIVVVVRDIFAEMEAMARFYDAVPSAVTINSASDRAPELCRGGERISYSDRRAVYLFENTEICIVQPVSGDTVYELFLERFGEGICCVRERIAADTFDKAVAAFREKGLTITQTAEYETGRAAWVDLQEELGILFEIISSDAPKTKPVYVNPQRIAQVNISTADVRKTITDLAEYLTIGPWEVGHQTNTTAHDTAFRVNGELKDVPFSFHLAILPCGNMEWEVIEPVKGPLIYNDFIQRRGTGFHHILMEIPVAKWSETIAAFEKNGAPVACKGSIDTIDWCYVNTEDDLHFYTELRTDAVLNQLPDGYLEYFYPEKERV